MQETATRPYRALFVRLCLGILLLGALLPASALTPPASAQQLDLGAFYTIVNAHSGKVLDVNARSTANGALVHQWSSNNGAWQQWRLVDVGGGYLNIVSRHSGHSLEVANWSTQSGEHVQQWAYNGGAWQQWRLVDVGGGLFEIESRHSGLVLDLASASTADGAKVQQWGRNGGAWQRWRLVPVLPERPIGWASVPGAGMGATTGGQGGARVTATTISQLQAYAKASEPLIITVAGSMRGNVRVASNKTLIGQNGATLEGNLTIANAQNVIVQNVTIKGYNCSDNPVCKDGADAVTVTNSHHIWFDHLAVSDGSDGNLDITQGSDFVTVSWSRFSYSGRSREHRFSNLIGSGDSVPGDRGKLNVTFHHNWWDANVDQRMPRTRYGKIHVFNNLYTATGNSSAIVAGTEAKLLVEQNLFRGIHAPHSVRDGGQLVASNNAYVTTSGLQTTSGAAFTPPYSYQLEATSTLEASIRSGAGPR